MGVQSPAQDKHTNTHFPWRIRPKDLKSFLQPLAAFGKPILRPASGRGSLSAVGRLMRSEPVDALGSHSSYGARPKTFAHAAIPFASRDFRRLLGATTGATFRQQLG